VKCIAKDVGEKCPKLFLILQMERKFTKNVISAIEKVSM